MSRPSETTDSRGLDTREAGPLRLELDPIGIKARISRRSGWSAVLPREAAIVIFDALRTAFDDDLDRIP